MSYTMQSPSQGYANPPAEVYGSRAYGGHLMSHNGIGNYPGYLNRDDPYSGNHYANGPPLQPVSHYVTGGSLAHHTYPGSMNHFASQQDMYNSCVVPSGSRTHSYPPPPNLSPNVARGHVTTSKSNAYWNCDTISQGSSGGSSSANHCYSSPSGAINSTHKSSPQAWSRSPNVMSSPSTTPSPIPCPPTPHHFASSPHHSQPHSDSHKSFNGVITNSSLPNNANTGANINCNNNNPLQSLQKMVQIDSEGSSQYDNGSAVAIAGQHSQTTAPPPHPPPHPLTTGIEQPEGNYQTTYYNLDQSRLCSTPQQSAYTNIPAQSINSVPFSPTLKNSPELRSQVIPNNNGVKQETASENGDLSLNRTRYSNSNKMTKDSGYLNNGSACSTDNCSNDSPSAQSNSKITPITESSIQGEQTHDSLNSFRGSETTANSRDSVKSSDSDAMSSYAMSQCSTPTNSWKAMNPSVNQSSEFRQNSYGSNTQSKSWWNENSMASTNRPFASQNLTECASYSNQGVNYPMTHSIANQPTSSSQSWTPPASNISSQGSVPSIGGPNYVTQPDGLVKKKRGRPFGSKNRRNVENGQVAETGKRKRKVMLVDIATNTNLSFDVRATLHHEDSIAFSEAYGSVKHPLPLAVRRKKVVGPVIRIDKSQSDFLTAKYSIVNNSLKCTDDDKDFKKNAPGKSTFDMCGQSRKNGLTKKSFNLGSTNLNLAIGDKSWICILCHKGPNYKGLGDLYGPYLVTLDKSKLSIAHDDTCSVQSDSHEEIAREVTPERRSLRRRPESTDDKSKTMVSHPEESKESNRAEMEVWIHEDCIVWSNSVYLEGTKIRNLEPAIIESFDNICTKCKLPGATLGCIFKNCTVSPLHYLCAKEKDCDLDEEKFILSCSKHKKRRLMPREVEHASVEVSEATTTATTDTC